MVTVVIPPKSQHKRKQEEPSFRRTPPLCYEQLQPAVQLAQMAVDQADQYLKTGSTGKPEKQGEGWSELPPKQRDEALQQIGQEFTALGGSFAALHNLNKILFIFYRHLGAYII